VMIARTITPMYCGSLRLPITPLLRVGVQQAADAVGNVGLV
jgi:hypothetical protein